MGVASGAQHNEDSSRNRLSSKWLGLELAVRKDSEETEGTGYEESYEEGEDKRWRVEGGGWGGHCGCCLRGFGGVVLDVV